LNKPNSLATTNGAQSVSGINPSLITLAGAVLKEVVTETMAKSIATDNIFMVRFIFVIN
jgi:hypothetical protein